MKRPLLLTTIVLIAISSYGQQVDSVDKLNPYDLMSNYYENAFKPFKKKNWYLGLAFSITDRKYENESRLILTVIDGTDRNYDLTLKGGYFIGDYVMAGLNLNYKSEKFQGLILQENDTIDRNSIRKMGAVAPFIKTYFPLSRNERLSFFNEVGIEFGFGNTIKRDRRNLDEINKTYIDDFTFSAGISPGITFFAMENFAFEVQLQNLIGYELKIRSTEKNEVDTSKTVSNNVNFDINLLSLNIGLAYYFGAKRK